MTNLDLLRSLGSVEPFLKNQTVFEQNDEGDMMYIVLKGIFGVYINTFIDFPVRVAAIRQGSFFGEMAVIDGWPRSASVVSEEDGAVLVIEKENFTRLLEKSPDICASMLETMQNRAAVTAASFADVGKDAPELPKHLMEAKYTNAIAVHKIMTMLARQIRQMNELRIVPAESRDQPLDLDDPETDTLLPGAVKLLPDGYVPYNLSDINDNSSMLNEKKQYCPYCGADFTTYIPLFPSLVQKRAQLDGRVVYENFDILWYTNIICPHCNYTDAYQEFRAHSAKRGRQLAAQRFTNAENFAGFAKTHKHTLDEVVLSYYQSLECLRETTNNPLRFAKAWLRLYWLYCDHGPELLMLEAAKEARSYYARYQSMKGDLLVTDDKMRVNAILGELSATLGDNEIALEYFKANTIIGRLSNSDILQCSLKRYGELRRSVH